MKKSYKKLAGLMGMIVGFSATALSSAQAGVYYGGVGDEETATTTEPGLQTRRRPDIAFIITNKTNHPVAFRSETFCADFPGTLVVKAGQQKFLIWGEAMNHGTCALLAKGILLKADGYNFKLDSAAKNSDPVFKPTLNEEWSFDVTGDGKITIDGSHYDNRDLYIDMTILK